METSPIRQQIQIALQNDQKIDAAEFETLKKTIETDKKVDSAEVEPLMDALTQNQFTKSALPAVISFLAQQQNSTEPEAEAPAAEASQPEAKPEAAEPEAKSEAETQAEESRWKKSFAVQGSFNHTSVSDGWNGQYGSEKTATKIEGSVQADVKYDGERMTWSNRVLVEYGNTFVKGEQDTERAVSRDNLEVTSEAGYKLEEKGHYRIEIPYASVYTKGPLTTLDGRKFRETTGAKITYTPNETGEYSVKVGAGFQQTHDPATDSWNNEFGVEVVAEAKQSMGFMKAPIVSALGTKEENVTFLDRFEANAQVNAFNPLQNGMALSNTDVGIKVGARYYLSDKKNIWVGVGKQWEYGGQEDSSWESKFTADAGFKFD